MSSRAPGVRLCTSYIAPLGTRRKKQFCDDNDRANFMQVHRFRVDTRPIRTSFAQTSSRARNNNSPSTVHTLIVIIIDNHYMHKRHTLSFSPPPLLSRDILVWFRTPIKANPFPSGPIRLCLVLSVFPGGYHAINMRFGTVISNHSHVTLVVHYTGGYRAIIFRNNPPSEHAAIMWYFSLRSVVDRILNNRRHSNRYRF